MMARRSALGAKPPGAASPRDQRRSADLTRELVVACYRQLLGREPEDDAVVREKHGQTAEEIVRSFLASPEYTQRYPPHFLTHYLERPRAIDVEVGAKQLAAMFERIRAEWSELGQADPFWSVLTDDAYHADAIGEEALRRFHESGLETASLIDLIANRCGIVPRREGLCIEFGCGVGRVTAHLAQRFERVLAVDISPGNLAVCREMLDRLGLSNVETRLLESPSEIASLPAHDFFFSTIVLQHNPPPIQHYILDKILKKISDGGLFLFQLPTNTPNYSFDASAYLASPPSGMELHCLPMASVLSLLAKHRLTPLEVMMDGWTGLYGSHTFFGVKRSIG